MGTSEKGKNSAIPKWPLPNGRPARKDWQARRHAQGPAAVSCRLRQRKKREVFLFVISGAKAKKSPQRRWAIVQAINN